MPVQGLLDDRRSALRAGSATLGDLVDNDAKTAALLDSDRPLLDPTGYLDVMKAAYAADGMSGLRWEKRRRLAAIAACDFNGDASFDAVVAALSDLADACLSIGLQDVDA